MMKLKTKEIAVFAMLGALMYASKLVMEALPNIHLLGTFVVAFTVLYRKKALYIIYTYVLILGLVSGFPAWWVANLYTWTVLWAVVMLIPKNMPVKIAPIVYMSVSALHGLLYGTLSAPAQSLLFGLNLKATLLWIAAGLSFDLIHGISNFICGLLIVPIIKALGSLKI